jgi:rRNA maturation RNase YbeY
MREKVDPYLRPIYDALYEFMDARHVERGLQTGMIEIAPLAFMRGRTLTNAVVLLDEAQNTTSMQMKMFLTRLGEGSRMIVTGDPSQIDLPPGSARASSRRCASCPASRASGGSCSATSTWSATTSCGESSPPTTRPRARPPRAGARAVIEVDIVAESTSGPGSAIRRAWRGAPAKPPGRSPGASPRGGRGDRAARRRRRGPEPEPGLPRPGQAHECALLPSAARAAPAQPRHLGDIALAYETLAREADAEGKTLADHATHLIVHGVLHLLGHDHETEADAGTMEALEIEALARLGIADPYRDASDERPRPLRGIPSR